MKMKVGGGVGKGDDLLDGVGLEGGWARLEEGAVGGELTLGARGGSECRTSSPTESVMGGIISAWNMRVVGVSFNFCMASSMSDDETAGNSSTPDSIRKPLKPRTPASTSGMSSSALPGMTPP